MSCHCCPSRTPGGTGTGISLYAEEFLYVVSFVGFVVFRVKSGGDVVEEGVWGYGAQE